MTVNAHFWTFGATKPIVLPVSRTWLTPLRTRRIRFNAWRMRADWKRNRRGELSRASSLMFAFWHLTQLKPTIEADGVVALIDFRVGRRAIPLRRIPSWTAAYVEATTNYAGATMTEPYFAVATSATIGYLLGTHSTAYDWWKDVLLALVFAASATVTLCLYERAGRS